MIIADHTKGLYDDKWVGDILHYTGMGQSGDQDINYLQNRTLAESNENDVDVHLFEVEEKGQYTYRGHVELAGEPYDDNQPDIDGKMRKVVVFPLKIKQE